MHLQQEAIVADRVLGHVHDVADVARLHAHAQHDQVGRHLQLSSEGERIGDPDEERIVVGGVGSKHLRSSYLIEAQEADAQLGGLT